MFDIFGSAAVEALAGRRNVIYFDFGLRKQSRYFKELQKVLILLRDLNLPNFSDLKSYFSETKEEKNSIALGLFE